MKIKQSAMAVIMLLTLVSGLASAADMVVGYNHIDVPANSDVHLTIPFNRNIFGEYSVTSVTAGGVTIADTLTANQYAGSFYVRFIDGAAEGLWSTVTSNTAGELVLEDAAVLGEVAVGDTFRVYEHYTIGSVFASGFYGVSFTDGSQILIYDNDVNNPQQNKSAVKVGQYIAAISKWIGAGVSSNTILEPETMFVLRNNSAQDLDFYTWGSVPDYTVSMMIAASGDHVIGTGYPVSVALTGSGLEGNSRQVQFYDNADGQMNKSAYKIAQYISAISKWIGAGVSLADVIDPSEAVVLRLPATETATRVMINKPY